jgi:hypothetical protein
MLKETANRRDLLVAMHTIELDASQWKTPSDFVLSLKAALGVPYWHGSTAISFADSMVAGGVNALKPPYVINVVNTTDLAPEVMELIREISLQVEQTRTRRLARTSKNVVVSLTLPNSSY